jgi:hypothetical protein
MTDELADRLQPHHLDMLRRESVITDDVILARGYRTITQPDELAKLGFTPKQRQVPGLLLPLHPTDGGDPALYIYRPDSPRKVADRKTGAVRVLKYEAPAGSGTRIDCPPPCQADLGNPRVDLWITEGQKKADSLASKGLCAIALLGVWNWKGKNADGGTTFLADWDYVALKGRHVHIVYDSDVMTKTGVQLAMRRLTEHLQRKGAQVDTIYLPQANGHKVGVDDYFAEGHTLQDLQGLIEAPRPTPQAAAPAIEILDMAPPTIRRPLSLVEGHGYAATWLYVRKTVTEALDEKTGQIIVYPQPVSVTGQELYVVRDDGRIYGPGGDQPLEELPIDVLLPEIPQAAKLWSKAGVMRYRAGQHADPLELFGRVVDTVDHFLDFSRSLADQRTMAEMLACYILHTYLLDAFQVTSFLWPNGDRGAGKTQTITLVADLAYLGQLVLAGGSFAALRDLADYGALLAFDDAENLSDPKQADPDKRTLLLAGNRKGAVVPLKELDGDKKWRTRYVDAFCPRCFSAIRIPDPVLASRTIVVPLIRTADKAKANRDPKNAKDWLHDLAQLRDDLWAFGLRFLTAVQDHADAVNHAARLMGRNLEPWRPILTVAHLLDALDTKGTLVREYTVKDSDGSEAPQQLALFQRLENVSVAYQGDRAQLETSDNTVLVLRAIARLALAQANQGQVSQVSKCAKYVETVVFSVQQLREAFDALAEEEDMDVDWMGDERRRAQRLGKVLQRLRVHKPPRSGGKGSRLWMLTQSELQGHMDAYGLTIARESESQKTLGTLGDSAHLAQGGLDDAPPDHPPTHMPASDDDDDDPLEVF